MQLTLTWPGSRKRHELEYGDLAHSIDSSYQIHLQSRRKLELLGPAYMPM